MQEQGSQWRVQSFAFQCGFKLNT